MKTAIAFCVLFFVAVALARPEADHYTDRYDNTNIQEIIENKKLLEAYINCILDVGKCTPDGKELKAHIQDALETECSKCTEPQKKGTKTMIKHLVNNDTESWNKLTAKYDPQNKYTEKYEKELKEVTA